MRSLFRIAVIAIALVLVTGTVYWWAVTGMDRRTIARLEQLNDEMETRLAERQAMIERLSRSRRLAHLQVLNQNLDASGTVLDTTVRLIELDPVGVEIDRQEFTVPGHVVFLDALTIKFDHEDVAAGHPFIAGTLVLLRRIYSDEMAPRDGLVIDTPGAVPPAYAASDAGEFEKRLWDSFWALATDAEVAARAGVRVAQGEAVYKPVQAGQTYELVVDATGGISLSPLASLHDGGGSTARAGE